MNVYMVRFTHRETGKVLLKLGHCKGKILEERFSGPEYSAFDIELVGNIHLTHKSFVRAKVGARLLEAAIRVVIPAKSSNFIIEDYLGVEPGTMKFSGVTEVVAPMSEAHEREMIRTFNLYKRQQHVFQHELEQS